MPMNMMYRNPSASAPNQMEMQRPPMRGLPLNQPPNMGQSPAGGPPFMGAPSGPTPTINPSGAQMPQMPQGMQPGMGQPNPNALRMAAMLARRPMQY